MRQSPIAEMLVPTVIAPATDAALPVVVASATDTEDPQALDPAIDMIAMATVGPTMLTPDPAAVDPAIDIDLSVSKLPEAFRLDPTEASPELVTALPSLANEATEIELPTVSSDIIDKDEDSRTIPTVSMSLRNEALPSTVSDPAARVPDPMLSVSDRTAGA